MAGIAEDDTELPDIVMGGTEEFRALVVVDGPNVAVGEGSKERPNLGAVEAAVKSLRSQNHKSFAILPRYFEKYVASDLLERLKSEEVVVIVPSQAHDDHFMLTYAKDHYPAFVLSNDMFRDHYTMYGEEWVKQTVIPFSFIGKKCVPAPEGIERAVRSGEAHPEAFGTGNGGEDDGAESSEAAEARASPVQPEPKRALPPTFDDPEDIDWLASDFDGVGLGADGVWHRGDSDEDGESVDEGEHEQAAAHGGEGSSPMEDADSDHELDGGAADRQDGAAWRPAPGAPAGASGRPVREADPGPAASHAPMRDEDEDEDEVEEDHSNTRTHRRASHRQSRDDHGGRRTGKQDRRDTGRGKGGDRGRGRGGGEVREHRTHSHRHSHSHSHGHGHGHGGSGHRDPLLAAAAKAVSSYPAGLASGRWKRGGTMAPRDSYVRAGATGGGRGGGAGRGRGGGAGSHHGRPDRPIDRSGDGGRDRGGRDGSKGRRRGGSGPGSAPMVEIAEGKPPHHVGRSRAGSHHSKGSGHGGRRPRIQSGDSLGSAAGAKGGKHHGSKSKSGDKSSSKSGKSADDSEDAEMPHPADIRDLSKVSTVVHLSSSGSSSPLPVGPIDESKLSIKERLALQRKRRQLMELAKASGAAPMQQQSPGKPDEFHVSSRTGGLSGPGSGTAGASAMASSSSSSTSASRADAGGGGDAHSGKAGRSSKQQGGRKYTSRHGGGKNPGGGGRATEGANKTKSGRKHEAGPKHESKASGDGATKGEGKSGKPERVVEPAALRDMSGVSTVVHLSSAAAPAATSVGGYPEPSYMYRLKQRQQRLQEARAKGAT